jgi:hypothetical protein
MNMISLKCS